MKPSTKNKLTDIFAISSIILLLISLGMIFYVSIYLPEQFENDYKKVLQQKYDRDYYKASLKVNENGTGEYFQDTKNIIIYTKNRYIWEVKETAIHEICHYVWFEFLNESTRQDWDLLSKNSVSHYGLNDSDKVNLLMNGSSVFVSEYAEKNELEDFAESCSAFWLEWNKLDFRKELFMKRYIKELIE